MQDEKSFTIIQEPHANFLHIYIPGKVPGDLPTQTICWKGIPKSSWEDLRKAEPRLRRDLKKKGIYGKMPEKIIPGYKHSYPYIFHPATDISITPDPKDLSYIRSDVCYDIRHSLWIPLLQIMKDKIRVFDYIQLDIPVLPKVITEELIQAWYQNNQRSSKFYTQLDSQSYKTRIEETSYKDKIVLSIKDHPFTSQPTQKVQIHPLKKDITATPKSEDLEKLRDQLLHRDVYYLKGLTDHNRKQLSRGTNSNLASNYQVHFRQWLAFGGIPNRGNAIIVDTEMHQTYQLLVQKPFEVFWRKNKKRLTEQNKPIIAELPIPMGEYRSKPIRKIRMQPQNRQKLNLKTQKEFQEYQRED